MARKGLTGQLNMFDLFKSMENVPMGEVQMVSLMPEDEPEELEESQMEEVSQVEETPLIEETSLIEETPQIEEQPQVEELPREKEQPRKKEVVHQNDKPAMSRQYVIDGKHLEIAYINYNKVRITREGEEPGVYLFESSKEAVDFYVQKMQELEPEE